jgi:hypothetical protein
MRSALPLHRPKLHRSAIGITERAGVIAEEARLAGAAGYADVLLDLLFRWHLILQMYRVFPLYLCNFANYRQYR